MFFSDNTLLSGTKIFKILASYSLISVVLLFVPVYHTILVCPPIGSCCTLKEFKTNDSQLLCQCKSQPE